MSKIKFDPEMQLRRDKAAILEGYITEYLFKKQFLDSKDPETYSHGWWIGKYKNRKFLFVFREKLNHLDNDIINRFKDDYNCWQVVNYNGVLRFYDIDNDEISFSKDDFLGMYNSLYKGKPSKATKEVSNKERQDRCIKFFNEHQLLDDIALERDFVDNFLSVHFSSIINVDYFTKNDEGKYCVIEVKFKTEKPNGNFGLNKGEINLFDELSSKGFTILHVILYKDRQHKDLTILDYIDSNDIEKYWFYHYFKIEDIVSYGVAPEETSHDGNSKQEYGNIPKDIILNDERKIEFNVDLSVPEDA